MTVTPILTFEQGLRREYTDAVTATGCVAADAGQSWRIEAADGSDLTALLTARAAEAAMRACGQGFITQCDYTITREWPIEYGEPVVTDAVAPLGDDITRATNVYRNGTSDPATITFQWATTVTRMATVTDTHTITTTFTAKMWWWPQRRPAWCSAT